MPRLKWVLRHTAACCVLLVLALAPVRWGVPWSGGAVQAAEGERPVIAIIDMQEILKESLAVQEMQRRMEELRLAYQDEFRKTEEVLRQRDQELTRERSAMSADSFAERRRELEQQVAEAQREIQQRRKSLEAVFAQGLNQVRIELVNVVQEIASERDADLVLAKTTVVLVRPDLEITAEALERLNERLPHIDLPNTND